MIAVTGHGHVVLGEGFEARCDPAPWVRVRKSRKYMGVQDDLAVVATGRALAQAGLGEDAGHPLGERAGLYLAVGYIPFERRHADPVLAHSLDDAGAFSMERFAADGYRKAHPLVTFRCLPNMPAYHVSASFDVQGPYFVGYPGAAQVYQALEEACFALEAGSVDVALVGGVACQRNFLVEHHFQRLVPPVSAESLRDAGAVVVLEREAAATARSAPVLARLTSMTLDYTAFDPRDGLPRHAESAQAGEAPAVPIGLELGPASLFWALGMALERRVGPESFVHRLESRDGIRAESRWRLW